MSFVKSLSLLEVLCTVWYKHCCQGHYLRIIIFLSTLKPHPLSSQVLDPELDLRSVKYFVWRSGGDMKLFYKEKHTSSSEDSILANQELPADSAEPASGSNSQEAAPEGEGEEQPPVTPTDPTPTDPTPTESKNTTV